MSDLGIWTVIIGLGVVTYVIRFSFLGLLAGRKLSPVVSEALGFVPVTVLPAIIAPMILLGPERAVTLDAQKIAAALVALGIGAITRNMLAAIVAGMATYILGGQLLGL